MIISIYCTNTHKTALAQNFFSIMSQRIANTKHSVELLNLYKGGVCAGKLNEKQRKEDEKKKFQRKQI